MKTIARPLIVIQLGFACLTAHALDLDPVQVGVSGETRSVIVQGHYAYCEFGILGPTAAAGGLRVFDVSNPTHPVPVGIYEARGDVSGLAVAGNYAYLGSLGSLHVIDVSNPTNPRLVGRYHSDFYVRSLAVAGSYAYLAGGILQVVDVSNPANPRRVGTYGNAGDNFSGVFVAGNRAYVATAALLSVEGFVVLDINNPSSPQRLGSYSINQATDVFVFGNFAFVGTSSFPAARQILDISDPANPRFVRYTPVKGFAVSGSYGYTGDYGGLGVLDVSDPGNPQLIGRYGAIRGSAPCISGNHAYLARGPGLEVVDISNFVPPSEWHGLCVLPAGTGVEKSISLSGTTACVGHQNGLFDVVDVSDPENPQRLGGTNVLRDIRQVFASGNYAYLTEAFSGMEILDVSNPLDPRSVGVYNEPGFLDVTDVFVSGSHAFLVGRAGFFVVDVSDPANPRRIWADQSMVGFRVLLSSNHAYVLGDRNQVIGLHVYNVSNPANPQPVGSYASETTPQDLFVAGNHAYLTAHGQGLLVLDVRNAASPQRVGRCKEVESGRVFASGTHAYVTASTLQVIDVSDTANPLLVGSYETAGPAMGVTVSGSYAYIPYLDGLQVLDLSVPPHAAKLSIDQSAYYFTATAVNVVISGNLAIVANGESGLFDLVDVSDVANLRRLSSHTIDGYAGGVFIAGDHAFLTGTNANVQILDVTDSADSEEVGDFTADSPVWDVAVSDGHAHVATAMDGVQVFDVSDPTDAHMVARYGTNDWVWGLFISGNCAYVWSQGGAEVFDVSDPAHPQRIAGLSTNPLINSVFVTGNHAYVGASDGLEIFDVADPANPRKVGGHPGGFGRMIVSGNRAYVATGSRLEVYDVSDPTLPSRMAIYNGAVGDLAVSGDYTLFASYQSGSLEVVNVGRLANPQRVGGYAGLSASAVRGGVSVSGDHALVADGTSGLQVLDVGTPAAPRRIGGYDTSGSAEDVSVAGNHAFVADWNGGLRVIDVSNPANPQLVASLPLPDHESGISEVAERVVVSGDYAYVTGYALHVVDVSNPAHPARVGGYAPPGGNLGIFVAGRHAYLVTGGRLHVVDVSSPTSPQLVGSWVGNYLFPPLFYDVCVTGGFAYVAAENSGLLVFDVRNPANPRLVGSYEINNAFSGGEDARSVRVIGQYAHVMDLRVGLYVLDVSNPLQPRRVGGNPNVGDIWVSRASGVTVAGDKLYLLAGERGLLILDLFRDAGALRLESLSPPDSAAFRFLLQGPPGLSGRIQRSSNLQNWEHWMPFSLGAAPLELADPATVSKPAQFYRAVSP